MNGLFSTSMSSLLLAIVMTGSSEAVDLPLVGQDPGAGPVVTVGAAPIAVSQETPSFGSVTRLHLRVGNEGEQSILFGSFMFLPLDFNFAGLLELDGKAGEWHGAGEAKLARPFDPQSAWGRAAGYVVRLQVGDLYAPVRAAGLQWNISDTPGIIETTRNVRWKSLAQVFVKSRAEYAGNESGLIDFYHWYQFPLSDWLYLRGVNTYYQVKGSRNYYDAMQDFIHPVSREVELFLHHEYRSADFMGKSKGSHFALGVRFAL